MHSGSMIVRVPRRTGDTKILARLIIAYVALILPGCASCC